MANNFTNVNLNTFFDKLDGGATWSAGVAFKRAAALPLERYEVHKSYENALEYATTNAVAYPGQVIAVVEEEEIKIYFIDENKQLQEVGSATLGDNVSIELDPLTKELSIKGFENAGFTATNDTTILDSKDYFTYEDGKYVKVELPTGNPKEAGYSERIAVKLIKDSAGNLAWITDDAVQIQGDIASLQITVQNHEQRITALETDVENINDKIDSLGTVLNFVGVLTTEQFGTTTNSDETIDTSKNGIDLDRPYRLGDVILVGNQEYVVTQGENETLKWEAFGDPTGIATLEADVENLKAKDTAHDNALTKLNGDENTEGSVKQIAKEKADTAESNANTHTNELVATINETLNTHTTDISGLKTTTGEHKTAIDNINSKIDTADTGIIARLTNLETNKADKTTVNQLSANIETLSNNKLDSSVAAETYATKTTVAEVKQTADDASSKAAENAGTITALQGTTSGLDGRLQTIETKVGEHTGQISNLNGKINTLIGEDGVSGTIKTLQDGIAANQTAASNAQSAAEAAQSTADSAVSAAAQAQGTADSAQSTANDAISAAGAAQADATKALADAKTADDKAAAAGTAAGNAQTTANEAKEKAEANEAKFALYDTIESVNGKISGVIGTTSDASTADTINGAKKYTDEKISETDTKINSLKTEIGNLANIMNFIGKSTTDPLSASIEGDQVTIGGELITPVIGDVVVYEALEYVYTDTGWEIFGNVTADENRFETIETNIASLQETVGADDTKGLRKKIVDLETLTSEQSTAITNVASRATALEERATDAEARLTATETIANAAATKVALDTEIERATGRENEIEQYAKDGFDAQAIQNNTFTTAINNITNEDNGLLVWGAF